MISIAARNSSLYSFICRSNVSISTLSILCRSFASVSTPTSSVCEPDPPSPRRRRKLSSKSKVVAADPAVYDVLVNKHNFSPNVASVVASGLARSRSHEKSDSILTFLQENGFSRSQLESVAKYRPRFLTAAFEDEIRSKIKTFQEWGFSPDEIAQITSRNQAILQVTVKNRIAPSLSVLKGLLGPDQKSIAELLRRCPRLVTADLVNTLSPNVELLKSCGIAMADIRRLLFSWPRILLVKPDFMKRSVEKAKESGVSENSRMFIYCVRVFTSLSDEAWEKKLQDFRAMGFSDSDVGAMFGKAPQVFLTSVKKIKKLESLLVSTGKFDKSSIVDHPSMVGCSVDKRIKPRMQILQILERKDLIKKWPSLGTIYTVSDERFFDRFVWPYSKKVGKAFDKMSYVKGRENSNLI